LAILCLQENFLVAQNPDKKAILKYLSELPYKDTGRVISGQFESWGLAVMPLQNLENRINHIYQKTGKWVGLVGAEYHNGQQVNYKEANQLFKQQWKSGGFCQLYLIMSNPSEPASFNGGGKCNIKSVLSADHSFNSYFYKELDKVAKGLKELQKDSVVIFLNMFPEATANWFWWGGNDVQDFITLYRNAHDYLVTKKGLDNLIFIYEPCSYDTLALEYYPGNEYVDIIGFSLFVDYDKEIDSLSILSYQDLKKIGKPLAISQWGPRRGKDQTHSADQPPANNLKLIKGIQQYYPEIVWWMNWNYSYSIITEFNSNYNGSELLNHPWIINRDEIRFKKQPYR
jgi:mannan endo-1,4-beta-mannosidase